MDTAKQQENELASALLQWVNSFELPYKVHSWQDLEDGAILWKILGEIDPEYFEGDLPELDRKQKGSKDNWIPRWQNLKHIDRMVGTYIREECEMLHHLSKNLNPDLKVVATGGSPENVIQLVKSVLLASMYSARSNQRLLIVEKVGGKGALAIAGAIQEMEELDARLRDMDMGADADTGSEIDHSTDSEAPAQGTSYERDPELEREEKLIQALQEKRRMEERVADLIEDLNESRERCRVLEDEIQESKFGTSKRRTTMDEENLQQLSMQADRDKDYIVKLESDLLEANSTVEQQARQLERFKGDDQNKQELRDELQLVRTERDELRQKAKMNENLKKKIQALQEQEKANANMRRDLQGAQEQVQEVEELKDRCAALEKANEENAKTIANGEQEIFDQKSAKEQLKYELKVLAQRFEQTRDMLTTAQETVRELEDHGHDSQSNSGSSGGLNDLDTELNAEDGNANNNERKATRRKSTLLGTSADTIVLQQNLTIAQSSIARLEQRCLDLLQENLGFKAVLIGQDSSSEHPFQHQARRLAAMEKDMEDVKGKYVASSTEASDLRRLLEISESQAYDERQTSTDAVIAQNRDKQKYLEELQTQLMEHRSLLRHALLSTEGLSKEAEEIRRGNEYKVIQQQLEMVKSAPADEAETVLQDTATDITNKIESSRTAVSEHEKRFLEQDAKIKYLTAELQAGKAQSPATTEMSKTAKEEIAILQRENKLMASAWYDLTCRLQSNTVMLTRRAEPPKSWLGKQRAAVGRR